MGLCLGELATAAFPAGESGRCGLFAQQTTGKEICKLVFANASRTCKHQGMRELSPLFTLIQVFPELMMPG